eukprot:tig00020704_g13174.t1
MAGVEKAWDCAAKGDAAGLGGLISTKQVDPQARWVAKANQSSPANGETLLHAAARAGQDKVIELLCGQHKLDVNVRDDRKKTPMHRAAESGKRSAAETLIRLGADPDLRDADGFTPMHMAAQNGHLALVDLFIGAQCNPNVRDKQLGCTPLHLAALRGHEAVVSLLCKCLVDAGSTDGDTALHWSASKGHESIAITLLQHGASSNAKNKDGNTPLHYASKNKHGNVVAALVSRGSDVNAVNKSGQSPVSIAPPELRGVLAVHRAQNAPPGSSVAPPAASPSHPPPATPAPSSGPADWEIDASEIRLYDKIGEGGLGKVYRSLFRGTQVAAKKLRFVKCDEAIMHAFRSEVDVMRKLRHPNIILFMGASTVPPEIYIVTEYMPRGSLTDVLLNKSIALDWATQLRMAKDAARGLNYLHLCKPPIVHRDLKSMNLLVGPNFEVKVSDFGLSRIVSSNTTMTGVTGTYPWMAPEVISSSRYGEKADVFSFGICLWEVVSRDLPYAGLNALQIAYGVVEKNLRPPIPASCPPKFAELIKACWDGKPEARPSFADIIAKLEAMG